MREAQKLQDFMVNAKVPREQRGRIPLVVAPQGIAWVVGWRIAEWAKVPDGGRRCLELRAERVGRD
jgi:tRNA(Ile)-lysidine synthase